MEQKRLFIQDSIRGSFTMTELCARYHVSRKTGYLWVDRYEQEGEDGLVDRSRALAVCPHRTPDGIERRILALRERYGWGAKKLLQVLEKRHPEVGWPARSTVNAILERHGKLRKYRGRRKWAHPGAAPLETKRPNQVWPAEFKTGDGAYCYPLTVTDGFSRYLLACQGLSSTAHQGAKPVFRRLFREYELPQVIRTDNGVPFATTALGRLSRLSVWWVRLGISPELIEPGHPEQNGRHERMHRTLKQHTARPPAASARAQQRRFHTFQTEYNELRPHEGIGQMDERTMKIEDALGRKARKRVLPMSLD